MGIYDSILQTEQAAMLLNLSCPYRKRLEVSENVKYIAVTSRASKLQVSKVSDSCERRGLKSRSSRTLETCNFEALKVTAMYFTFSETSNLFLFGQERSRG